MQAQYSPGRLAIEIEYGNMIHNGLWMVSCLGAAHFCNVFGPKHGQKWMEHLGPAACVRI
jgi:hypothetical protein